MACATFDRFLPRSPRRQGWLVRLADIAGAACRAVWANTLSGFAARGAAQVGHRLDLEPSCWTEADLDTLLSVPVAATSVPQRKLVP